MAYPDNTNPSSQQDRKKKNEDISTRVLKMLIFECVLVLLLFVVMIVILVVRAQYPEDQASPIRRKTVSGDVFHGEAGAQTGRSRFTAMRNVLGGDVSIAVKDDEILSPKEETAGKSPDAALQSRSRASDPAHSGNQPDRIPGPLPLSDGSAHDPVQPSSDSKSGRVESVITTQTTREYRGNVIVETVITKEEKGDIIYQTTVVTETKNGVVIRKIKTESTTTVMNDPSSERAPSDSE